MMVQASIMECYQLDIYEIMCNLQIIIIYARFPLKRICQKELSSFILMCNLSMEGILTSGGESNLKVVIFH